MLNKKIVKDNNQILMMRQRKLFFLGINILIINKKRQREILKAKENYFCKNSIVYICVKHNY